MKRLCAAFLLLACRLSVALAGDTTTTTTLATTTTRPPLVVDDWFKVLHVCSTTSYRNGLETWRHWNNDNGGIVFGTEGRRYGIQIDYIDNFTDPNLGQKLTDAISGGGYDFVANCRSVRGEWNEMISELAENSKIMNFETLVPVESAVFSQPNGQPWRFKIGTAPPAEQNAKVWVQYAKTRAGCEKLALVTIDDPTYIAARDGARIAAATAGLKIVYDYTMKFATPTDAKWNNVTLNELKTMIQEMRDLGVDCVAPFLYDDGIPFNQILLETDYNLKANYQISTTISRKIVWKAPLKKGMTVGDYLLVPAFWHPSVPNPCPIFGSGSNFNKLGRGYFPNSGSPSQSWASAASTGVMFQLGLKGLNNTLPYWDRSNDAHRQAIVNAVGVLNLDTFIGTIRFNRNNMNVGVELLLTQMKNLTQYVVAPESVKDKVFQLTLPVPTWETRKESACPPGKYDDGMKCAECPAQTYTPTNGTVGACLKCPVGQGQTETGQTQCEACPAGYFASQEGVGCLPCNPGSFNDKEGQTQCSPCAPGFFADVAGLALCKKCADGMYVAHSGAQECLPCAVGTFRDGKQEDASTCQRCPTGTYQPRSSSTVCLDCPNGRTTFDTGAELVDRCVCAEGTFWNRKDDKCETCLLGTSCAWRPSSTSASTKRLLEEVMDATHTDATETNTLSDEERVARLKSCYGRECPIGLGLPVVEKGYTGRRVARAQVASFQTPEVYQCQQDTVSCPGGELTFPEDDVEQDAEAETAFLCGIERVGIGCNVCPKGYAQTLTGCDKCAGQDVAIPWIGTVFGVGGGAALLHMIYNSQSTSVLYDTMSTGLVASQLLTFVQGVNVVSTFKLDWDPDFINLTNFLSFVKFNFNFLTQGCGFAEVSSQYMYSLFFPLMFIGCILVEYVIAQLVTKLSVYKRFQIWALGEEGFRKLQNKSSRAPSRRPSGTQLGANSDSRRRSADYQAPAQSGDGGKSPKSPAAPKSPATPSQPASVPSKCASKAGLVALEQEEKERKYCCGTLGRIVHQSVCFVLRRLASGAMDINCTMNTIGSAMNSFYVSVVVNCLVPYYLVSNPSGVSTVERFRQVAYGSEDWKALVSISAVGLFLYGGLWLPYLVWAVSVAPEKTSKDATFLKRFSFLIPTYRVDVWWWGVALVFRGLLIAFIPVFGGQDGQIQATLTCLIVGFYTMVHLRIWPYNLPINNYLDGCLTFVLVLISAAGMHFSSKTAALDPSKVKAADSFFGNYLMALLAIAIGMVVFAVVTVLRGLTNSAKEKKQEDCEMLSEELIALSKQLAIQPKNELQKVLVGLDVMNRATILKACVLYQQEILCLKNIEIVRQDSGSQRSFRRLSSARRICLADIAIQEGSRVIPGEAEDGGESDSMSDSEPELIEQGHSSSIKDSADGITVVSPAMVESKPKSVQFDAEAGSGAAPVVVVVADNAELNKQVVANVKDVNAGIDVAVDAVHANQDDTWAADDVDEDTEDHDLPRKPAVSTR